MALRHARKGSEICLSAFIETKWNRSAKMRLLGRRNALPKGYAESLSLAPGERMSDACYNGPQEGVFTENVTVSYVSFA